MFTFFGHNKKVESPISEKSVQFEHAVYWFRDYWSNRLRLNRNVNAEEFDIDIKKGALSGELTIDSAPTGKCNVKWVSGQLVGLVEPFTLTHQYEPLSISFPFNKSGIRDESPDPNYRIDSDLVKKVIATPLVQTKGELRLWLSVLLRVIIPSVIFLIVEATILSNAAISNPELARFSFTVMAVSIALFLYFLLVVFVRMGISESTKKILSAKVTIYLYHGQQAEKHHYRYPQDIPKWLEAKPYWVFRYVYSWSFELTPVKGFPLIRAEKDVERLDVWLDAKSGIIEWIVSDYHWRELWYRAEPTLENVYVWVLRNFHTLRPLNISLAGKGTLSDLYLKGQPLSKLWMENLDKYKSSHSNYFSTNKNKKLGIGDRLLFSNLNDLWWEKWRYNYGANAEVYKKPVFPATGEQPSVSAPTLPKLKPMTVTPATPTIPSLKVSPSAAIGIPVIVASQTVMPTVKPIVTKANIVTPTSSTSTLSKRTHAFLYTGIAAAAILVIVTVGYLYENNQKKAKLSTKATPKNQMIDNTLAVNTQNKRKL